MESNRCIRRVNGFQHDLAEGESDKRNWNVVSQTELHSWPWNAEVQVSSCLPNQIQLLLQLLQLSFMTPRGADLFICAGKQVWITDFCLFYFIFQFCFYFSLTYKFLILFWSSNPNVLVLSWSGNTLVWIISWSLAKSLHKSAVIPDWWWLWWWTPLGVTVVWLVVVEVLHWFMQINSIHSQTCCCKEWK